MNVSEILAAAHVNYEQATDAPALTDEDGQIRLSHLRRIVSRWATDNNTRWLELFTVETIGPISASTTEYSLPDELNLAESFYLQGSDTPLPVRKPWQLTGVEGRFVYILGNPSEGYTLNLGWTPTSDDPDIGKTIRVIHYRDPEPITSGSQILEMKDPYYAVDELTAELFANDDVDLYNKWHNDALNRLANMRDRNDQNVVGEDNSFQAQNAETDFNFGE